MEYPLNNLKTNRKKVRMKCTCYDLKDPSYLIRRGMEGFNMPFILNFKKPFFHKTFFK